MATPAAPDPQTATRISATADSWKRKLLDLTKRNRALNFRINKVSTVTIVDEQPAEVFRQLYIRERAMKFKAAPEPEVDQTTPAADNRTAAPPDSRAQPAAGAPTSPPEAVDGTGDTEDDALALDFAPYDPASLDERHTDEWLQTASTPDALDKSLRRLDEQARLSIEEQGVNTLFLALGMLDYSESADSDVVLRAPLVLLPVELSRKSARTGYSLRAGDDEPLVNPALVECLRRDHGIDVPQFPIRQRCPRTTTCRRCSRASSRDRDETGLGGHDRHLPRPVLLPEVRDVQGPGGQQRRAPAAPAHSAGRDEGPRGQR